MKKFYCLFFVVPLFAKSYAQDPYVLNDAALWCNLYIEKKISNHFSVHLNQQDRLNNNFTRYGLGYADVGITFRPLKGIKILADYVFVEKQRVDYSYSTKHQFYVAIMLKKDIGRFAFCYRNMIQSQYADVYSSVDGRYAEYYERNKYTVKYELNKYITPYVAQEIYLPMNATYIKGFDKLRTFAGGFYNVTRTQQLELYFLFQQQLQSKNARDHDYIYGIGYSIYL